MGGSLANHSLDNPRIVSVDRVTTVKDRSIGYAGGRPEVALPSDASNTLFVEGLPANCTRREVARIQSTTNFMFLYIALLMARCSLSY